MNVIQRIYEILSTWIGSWSDGRFSFFPQAILVLGLPALVCFAAFNRGSRSVMLQCLLFCVSVLAAAAIPVEKMLPRKAGPRTFLFAVCFTILLFLPAVLPTFLTRQRGNQARLRILFWLILLGLFLANLFFDGRERDSL